MTPNRGSEPRCETYLPGGWCRNKVAFQVPHAHGRGPKSLCRKHAIKEANEILAANERLVWALCFSKPWLEDIS